MINTAKEILITTTDSVPGKTITKVFGLISATSVESRGFGRDIVAGFRNLAGGKITEYEQMAINAQNSALKKIEDLAKEKGCNAIIGLRYATPNTTQHGTAEIIMYGTAVVVE